MPTFGDTTSGTDTFPSSDSRALMDRFAISENGTADSISHYCGAGTTAGTSMKGLIYTDSAGAPGTLVAVSASGTMVASTWVTMALAGESLSTGNYWLGVVANDSSGEYGSDTTGSAPDAVMANGTLSYTTPPGTWPGTDASYGLQVNVYVTYTAGGGTVSRFPNTSSILQATNRSSVF